MKIKTGLWSLAVTMSCAGACVASESPRSLSELREHGAFEFPQKEAKVLCNQPDLRLSAWNNDEYLFAQAVLWTDGDASLGKTEDNREIGDWSQLLLDLDADGKATPQVDREYFTEPLAAYGRLTLYNLSKRGKHNRH